MGFEIREDCFDSVKISIYRAPVPHPQVRWLGWVRGWSVPTFDVGSGTDRQTLASPGITFNPLR